MFTLHILCMGVLVAAAVDPDPSLNSGVPFANSQRNWNTYYPKDSGMSKYKKYLDAAGLLIKAAKDMKLITDVDPDPNEDRIDENVNLPGERVQQRRGCPSRPVDCEDLFSECLVRRSGTFKIFPRSRLNSWGDSGFDVYCDMDTDGGGWTVIQRRDDFGTNSDFFFKNWLNYKFGFGDLNYDYWLGNDKIFALSNQRRSALRFDLLDFNDEDGWATYDNFYIDDETQGYRLHIGDYRGIIGDSFRGHNLMRFTSRDRDNDNNRYQNCAQLYKGGWWYNNCHTANLNGLYLKGSHDTYADGINWYGWKGFRYSLKRTEMKVRSVEFNQFALNSTSGQQTTQQQQQVPQEQLMPQQTTQNQWQRP